MPEEGAEIPINIGPDEIEKEPELKQPPKAEEVDPFRQQLEASIYAEFENYKKRSARDLEEVQKYANERLLRELLPVVDNLERAIFHAKEFKESTKILEGLELVLKQSLEVLGKFGVNGFESYLKPFDPAVHQAMGEIESEEHEGGLVIQEIQKGYRLNDRILRPAMVLISRKKALEETGPP
jgi:molecular chaperone GrpE